MVRGGVRERSERGFLGPASVASGFFLRRRRDFFAIYTTFFMDLDGFVRTVELSLHT